MFITDARPAIKLEQYNKPKDFWGLGQQERNHAPCLRMRTLPPEEKTSYIARNGLNRVRVDRAVRLAECRVRWIKYRTGDVLDTGDIAG